MNDSLLGTTTPTNLNDRTSSSKEEISLKTFPGTTDSSAIYVSKRKSKGPTARPDIKRNGVAIGKAPELGTDHRHPSRSRFFPLP